MNTDRSSEELFCFLVGRVAEVIADRIKDEVPNSGDFSPLSVSFVIPGTDKKGCMYIEPSLTASSEFRRLAVAVRHKDSDRMITNYLFHGTNENIIEYLHREQIVDELLPCFLKLSERIDDD